MGKLIYIKFYETACPIFTKPFIFKAFRRPSFKSKKTTELKNDCLVLSFDRHDKKLNKNP
jgi:hypothetical protein